eukprot:2839127-Alexandrium_andersonii.AAC.1
MDLAVALVFVSKVGFLRYRDFSSLASLAERAATVAQSAYGDLPRSTNEDFQEAEVAEVAPRREPAFSRAELGNGFNKNGVVNF